MDALDRLCTGCGRTRWEIANWRQLSTEQQLKLRDELKTREGPHLRTQRRIS